MEAPEKVYLSQIEKGIHYYTEEIPFEREYIEYTRKDAFIEKACDAYFVKYVGIIHILFLHTFAAKTAIISQISKSIWRDNYGDNIQDGICGFGDTIDRAAWDFYTNLKSDKL